MQLQRRSVWMIALGVALSLGAVGCGDEGQAQDVGTTTISSTPAGESGASAAQPTSPASTATPGETSAEATTGQKAPVGKNPIVVLDTSMGVIKIQLDSEKAPISTKNFVEYVNSGHYNGTTFHRVIADFMIQGGGYSADLKEKPTRDPIKNEGGNGLKNKKGTIAMARTSVPDSATSQFFINVVDNGRLDREQSGDGVGYAVFGKVIQGMDVVEKIRTVPTGMKGGMRDVPIDAVTIKSAKLEK